jgi:hypothetical protein
MDNAVRFDGAGLGELAVEKLRTFSVLWLCGSLAGPELDRLVSALSHSETIRVEDDTGPVLLTGALRHELAVAAKPDHQGGP